MRKRVDDERDGLRACANCTAGRPADQTTMAAPSAGPSAALGPARAPRRPAGLCGHTPTRARALLLLGGAGLLCAGDAPRERFIEPGLAPIAPAHECFSHEAPRATWPRGRAAGSSPTYDLVVGMLSARANWRQRQALLTSWAIPGQRCSVLFVLIYANETIGAPARHEWAAPSVLDLTLRTPEVYGNLPTKVLGAFEWIATHVRYKYLLKTDDDAYACVGGLLATLVTLPRAGLYWGKMRKGGVAVQTEGKWQDDGFGTTLGTRAYGVYAFGAGYVLSHDLAMRAAETMLPISRACRVEDGLVGAALLGTRAPVLARAGAGARPAAGPNPHGDPTPCAGRDADGLPPVAVRAVRWRRVPSGSSARPAGGGGAAPRGAWMGGAAPSANASSALGGARLLMQQLEASANDDDEKIKGNGQNGNAPAIVHLVNTSRIKDRNPFKAAENRLGKLALDSLCVRTSGLAPRFHRFARPAPQPRARGPLAVRRERAPTARPGAASSDGGGSAARQAGAAVRGAERVGPRAALAVRAGWSMPAASASPLDQLAQWEAVASADGARAGAARAAGAWRRRLAAAARGAHRGHYLIIHRIKPWLVKRCAVDAGSYCTAY